MNATAPCHRPLAARPLDPALEAAVACRELTQGGTQLLAVDGYVTDRLLITYRAPAARLAPLVPKPFDLDSYQGFGFVSVCAVEIRNMGIFGSPRFLRWDNRELLYRLAVRLRGEPTFVTLRSDVSSRTLAVLGRYFSHYRPRKAHVTLTRGPGRLELRCTTPDGSGDGWLEAHTKADASRPASVFPDSEQATSFLLGMSFSADVARGRVRVQPIEHTPWHPRFVKLSEARLSYIDQLAQTLGTSLELDNVLASHSIHQIWKAARWA